MIVARLVNKSQARAADGRWVNVVMLAVTALAVTCYLKNKEVRSGELRTQSVAYEHVPAYGRGYSVLHPPNKIRDKRNTVPTFLRSVQALPLLPTAATLQTIDATRLFHTIFTRWMGRCLTLERPHRACDLLSTQVRPYPISFQTSLANPSAFPWRAL